MIRGFAFPQADGSWEEGAFCLLEHKGYNQNGSSMVMIDRWHGLVLSEYERNYRDDSDFYAVVWDKENQVPKDIQYATTRGWTYACGCIVDATPDIIAEFEAFRERQRKEWAEYHKKLEKYIPKVGEMARSTTTRGKAKGKQGVITWIGNSNYSLEKLVRIDGAYVETPKIELWDEAEETWIKPAKYSRTFECWVVSESVIPMPKCGEKR